MAKKKPSKGKKPSTIKTFTNKMPSKISEKPPKGGAGAAKTATTKMSSKIYAGGSRRSQRKKKRKFETHFDDNGYAVLLVKEMSEYDDDWGKVREQVEGVENAERVKVHLLVEDPTAVQVAGRKLFRGCEALGAITLPHVEVLGAMAFYECSHLSKAVLPKVSSVGSWTLALTKLTNVSLPSLRQCRETSFMQNYWDVPPVNASTMESYKQNPKIMPGEKRQPLIVGIYVKDKRDFGSNWYTVKKFCDSISSLSTSVSSAHGGKQCPLIHLTVSDPTVVSLDVPVFKQSYYIYKISLLYVENICPFAFEDSYLVEAELPSAVLVADFAFAKCKDLKVVSIPNIIDMSPWVFDGTTNLTLEVKNFERDFQSSWTKVRTRLFEYGKEASVHLLLSDPSVLEIVSTTGTGFDCFRHANNIKKVTAPHIETIGDHVFEDAHNLSTIDFPKCTTIGAYAFSTNYDLEKINFPQVVEVKMKAFEICFHVEHLSLPRCTKIGSSAFENMYDLRAIDIDTEALENKNGNFGSTFQGCTILHALAASVSFDVSSLDYPPNPSRGVRKYILWRAVMDENKKSWYTYMLCLKLVSTPSGEGNFRATTEDPIMDFLIEAGPDVARYILSFALGEKRGKGDLRKATREELKDVVLETKALVLSQNEVNHTVWDVYVDRSGAVVTLEDAISRNLINQYNANAYWGLSVSPLTGNLLNYNDEVVGNIEFIEEEFDY